MRRGLLRRVTGDGLRSHRARLAIAKLVHHRGDLALCPFCGTESPYVYDTATGKVLRAPLKDEAVALAAQAFPRSSDGA